MTRNTFHGDPIGRLCGDGEHKQVDLAYRGKFNVTPMQTAKTNE